ncbi:hypothetical protein NIES25_51850 [Nostoc linckia NIES-25]|nr:hypothetical protein NIES25_05720 [Nostoc linckia NIES-25]BAY78681.1 hypothetical protein NIES25_51570 [Nostoc linckia NIES-25]BAY78709.1 hypothetical protein NIES25_51850 [Nostoc linckia NIES-25]
MHEPLDINDFCQILDIISRNDKQNRPLTHKQIRVYLECISELWPKLDIQDTFIVPVTPRIKFYFHAMSCWISHEKRAFLAEKLIELLRSLEKNNKSKQQDNFTQVQADPIQQNLTQEEPDPDDIPFNQGDVSVSLETSPGNF